jgi:hypothetical protein
MLEEYKKDLAEELKEGEREVEETKESLQHANASEA